VILYLFWHRPEAAEAGLGYEEGLIAFHRRLADQRVPGLAGSATFRVRGLPWLGPGAAEGGVGDPGPRGRQPEAGTPPSGQAYEDWYAVGGFGDLEPLNRTAVGPALRAAHDRPALAAAVGAGGLYELVAGPLDLAAAAVTWLSKPRGVPSQDFLERLPAAPFVLRRQLALGPALEFCAGGEVPGGLVSHRTRLYPPPP
jgi:hypothetical protein